MQSAGPWPQGATASTAAGFELSESQNVVVRNLASAAKLWGIVSVATGSVLFCTSVGLALFAVSQQSTAMSSSIVGTITLGLGPSAAVSLVCGWFYLSSARSLREVVDTQGNDIPLLVGAMDGLKRAFMIEAIGFILAMVATMILHAAGVLGK